MSILTEKLPISVKIGGHKYPIHADFRTILRMEALRETHASQAQCGYLALSAFYGDNIPADVEAATQQMLWFLRLGKGATEQGGSQGDKPRPPDFSFSVDAPLLFAAFYDQYQLDLESISFLHWWKFRALFDGLRDDHRFCEVRRCRNVDLGRIKDPELRRYYREMKQLYALPQTQTDRHQMEQVVNALLGDGDVQRVLGEQTPCEAVAGTNNEGKGESWQKMVP